MAILQNRLSTTPVVADYIDPSGRDYTLNEDWEAGPIAVTDTSEGLAYQAWKLTYSEEAGYNPAVMRYDGVLGRYELLTTTYIGNKVTAVCRIKADTVTGAAYRYLMRVNGTTGKPRLSLLVADSDNADAAIQNKLRFRCVNAAGAELCNLMSTDIVTDGEYYTVFASYDADLGTATFYINGADADDPAYAARVLTTGVLEAATSDGDMLLATSIPGGGLLYQGDMGYVGYRDVYLTNWTDFMENDGTPKELDEVTWTEWGTQPLFWNDEGEMTVNKGSAGNMTQNGTITKVFLPEGGTFTITPETVGDPVVVLSGVTSSQQCTLAFDQNGRPTIAWEDLNQQGYLYWYDTVDAKFVTTAFQQPVTGIALTLDDKRIRQSGANDILLFYTQPNQDTTYTLYHRRQRDRYGVTYELQNPSWPYIHKCGMHEELRVQLTLSTDPPA